MYVVLASASVAESPTGRACYADVLTVMSSASAREMVREWEHIKSLCSLLYHPIMSVRRQAALCVCHVSLAPERVKASAYRKVMGFGGHNPAAHVLGHVMLLVIA